MSFSLEVSALIPEVQSHNFGLSEQFFFEWGIISIKTRRKYEIQM
jgi:hypothetical protein